MNNEYECRYLFEDKINYKWTSFVYKDSFPVMNQNEHKPCETAILLMTDKQFTEMISKPI